MIVTHSNPDFDCIVATWLLKRFCGMNDSEIKFIKFGGSIPIKYKDAVFVDIGKGEFDHHHRDDFVSSATLILEKFNLQNDSVLKKLADITRRVDHGFFNERAKGILDLINIISGLNTHYPNDPIKVMRIAFECLDAIYKKESQSINFEEEFSKGIKFRTRWGSGIGIESHNLGVREYCYNRGHIIFVYVNPITKYRGIAAKGRKGVDFSEVYERIRTLEPDAEWYLHFSKDLLICGSDKAINKKLSKLTLEELIDVIKNI